MNLPSVVSFPRGRQWGWGGESAYIKLPPFEVLAGVLARDHDDKLAEFPTQHPFLELAHELLNVGFDLVVGGNKDVEAIFLDCGEVLGRVYAALKQDGVDRVLKELSDEFCGACETVSIYGGREQLRGR